MQIIFLVYPMMDSSNREINDVDFVDRQSQ